ncbi:hypothetical protein Tco_1022171, partial [Tanacetum coccineum]
IVFLLELDKDTNTWNNWYPDGSPFGDRKEEAGDRGAQSPIKDKLEDNIERDDDDSQDNNYIVDENNNVDEVHVDMNDFNYNSDKTVEFMSASDSDNEELRNKDQVTAYIKDHSIETVREIRMEKNDNKRVRGVCRGVIPSLPAAEDHNLDSGLSQSIGSKVEWTKEKITRSKGGLVEQLKTNLKIPIREIQEQLQQKHELVVSQRKGFGVKQEAEKKFRIYVCLEPLKAGFKAVMRDLLGLYRAFMKGPYPGQLLTAVNIDPNNDVLLNNMYEVSNGNLVGGKDKHIISTLEFSREYLMKRIMNRLIEICDGLLIPSATNILKANSNEANKYIVHRVKMSFTREHKTVTCDKFHNKGHNSRSYTGPRVPKSKKRKAISKAVDLDIEGPTSSQSKKISSGDGPTCSESKKGSSGEAASPAYRKTMEKHKKDDGVKKKEHQERK